MLGYQVNRKRDIGPVPGRSNEGVAVSSRVNSPNNNDAEIIVPIDQLEKGSQTKHGEFCFDSGEELNVGDRV
jgi:hypothetical protein